MWSSLRRREQTEDRVATIVEKTGVCGRFRESRMKIREWIVLKRKTPEMIEDRDAIVVEVIRVAEADPMDVENEVEIVLALHARTRKPTKRETDRKHTDRFNSTFCLFIYLFVILRILLFINYVSFFPLSL